ncbi:MAG: amylo-alpha-1,6-glucosidase [Chloroflexales bacterium]|nr:amylo-alpha-1,6-glucosidase [Chloroflexales bacterium]
MVQDGTLSPTITEQALVRLGREICGDLDASLRREWLVTNGLGGYASSTLAGVNTRRYHGLLVAALNPPVERTALVGGMIEWATYAGQRYALSTHEYRGGYIDQNGYRNIESFMLEGMLPIWTFALGGALIEKRIWMAYGANTTYLIYRVVRGFQAVELELTPLLSYRDFHVLTREQGWQPAVEAQPRGAIIRAFDGARPFRLHTSAGQFIPKGVWFRDFQHRAETSRGLDDQSDSFAPGAFSVRLAPGETYTLALSAEAESDLDGPRALAVAQERQRALLSQAAAADDHPVVQQLVLAADQFIVARTDGVQNQSKVGKTVIAGYHWFNDWGRDTMIALPGLTLATGRSEDAADILRTFARYVADGLLPNNFPDSAGNIPGYNTVDATLWYAHALRAYYQSTGDRILIDDLLPVLREIAERHIAGTRYGIGVDPDDGLLRAGEPGVQLTWMDAKIGDWVVTPRIGKPVEINALWYNLLRTLAGFLVERDAAAAETYRTRAEQVRTSFRARFIHPVRGFLADVIDGPDGDDWTVRPNQIFAVALPDSLLEDAEARTVVVTVAQTLLTSYGLRSLGPEHPLYRGDYGGDPVRRDSSYHQGPVWTWLMGAFVEAYARAYGDRSAALALLEPFVDHLRDACLGSVSEILEGDPPHLPRGAIAQAWGVAEVLRVWRALSAQ